MALWKTSQRSETEPNVRNLGATTDSGTRLYMVFIALAMALVAVIVKLFLVQIVHGNAYAALADAQSESRVVLRSERGTIYDRSLTPIASSLERTSFAVDPTSVDDGKKIISAFAKAFGKPQSFYAEKLSDKEKEFVWLEKDVEFERAKLLSDLKDHGLIRIIEPHREYNFGQFASQLIGFTNTENQGLSGLELLYNEDLAGRDGYMLLRRDGRGARRPDVDYPRVEPEHGTSIVLTIDGVLQRVVESELLAGVEKAGAKAGMAIALDPKTGAVLAMASVPTFDPNSYGKTSAEQMRNRIITDIYEPGSTFKLITAGAALEEGVMHEEDKLFAENGAWMFGVHNIKDTHPHGMLTFRDALVVSSNICFAKISQRIVDERFYKYVRDFGFGIITGIDAPGELRGIVKKPNEWSQESKAYMAFGYQIGVTPLQIANAYATIANGGVMMKPFIVAKELSHDGKIISETRPQIIRRVVSEQTAKTLTSILEDVVERGTATATRVDGVHIAGKTGTAQQLVDGKFSKEKYYGSFVGFFPAEDPQMVLLVIMDSPVNGYTGGVVAAPVVKAIINRIIATNVLHFPAKAPDQLQAREEMPATVSLPSIITKVENQNSEMQMPDVRGMTVRRARACLAGKNIDVKIVGSGVVRRQEQQHAQACTLYCEPGS